MLNVTKILFSALEGIALIMLYFSSFVSLDDARQKTKKLQMALVASISIAVQATVIKPIGLIVVLLASSVINWVLLHSASPAIPINIMLLSMVIQLISLLSIFPVQVVFSVLHLGNAMTAINLVRMIPWCILLKLVMEKVKTIDICGLCERYALAIEAAYFVLFFISYSLIKITDGADSKPLRFLSMVVLGILLFALAMWYLIEKDRAIRDQRQRERIAELVAEAHRYKESVPAVERSLLKLQMQMLSHNVELADEISASIYTVSTMRKEMEKEAYLQTVKATKFKSTGLFLLDTQLEEEQRRAAEVGVFFHCVVFTEADAPLHGIGMPEHLLMQILGDLYRNAMKAIEESRSEPKQILLTMGNGRNGYQIQMSDTGVPFPCGALETLGNSTAISGEHGYGYPDICRVLAQYGASIEINELTGDTYTKTISIVFDGQKELRIATKGESEISARQLECGDTHLLP